MNWWGPSKTLLSWILFVGSLCALPPSAQEWDTVWTVTYGGPENDGAFSVAIDNENYYVVTGVVWSAGTGEDLLILKLNPATGDTLWSKKYTTGGYFFQRGYSVTVDTANYYVVAGQYDDSVHLGFWDHWILKIDASNGDTLWARSYGGNASEWATSVAVDSQGYYAMLGRGGASSNCFWVLKINPEDGDTIWTRKYWEGGTSEELPHSITVDKQGNYVVTGTKRIGTNDDVLVIKLEPTTGDTLWTKTYGGAERNHGWSIAVDHYGYYIVVGHTNIAGNYDIEVRKLDPAHGDTLWTRVYGGFNDEAGLSVTVNSQGYYLIAGLTESFGAGDSDIWILKIDPVSGDTLWTKTYGGSYYERANSIVVDSQNYYVLAGWTGTFGAGNMDWWVLKLKGMSTGISEDPLFQTKVTALQTAPNPFNNRVDIRFHIPKNAMAQMEIRDVTGCLIKHLSLSSTSHVLPAIISWDGRDNSGNKLPSGVYFLKLTTDNYCATEKLLLIR